MMSPSTLAAKLAFSRNCVRGAERFELTGQPFTASELRASAREALAGVRDAAVADAHDCNPQTMAYARVLLQGLH